MDTIILKIYGPNKFQINNTAWFLPEIHSRQFFQLSATEKQSTRMYLRRFILQPPAHDGYLPKIDVLEVLNKDRDDVRYVLRAEFSLPKLIYGNSLREVSETDLDKSLYAFKRALANAGIIVDSTTIANARISAVHFCKSASEKGNLCRELKLCPDVFLDDTPEALGSLGGIVPQRFFFDRLEGETPPPSAQRVESWEQFENRLQGMR